MTVAYRSVSSSIGGTANPGSYVDMALQPSMVAGDLLIAVVQIASGGSANPTINTPAGWGKVRGGYQGNAWSHSAIFWKVATAGDISAGTVHFTGTANSYWENCLLVAYSTTASWPANPIFGHNYADRDSGTNQYHTWASPTVVTPKSGRLVYIIRTDEGQLAMTWTSHATVSHRVHGDGFNYDGAACIGDEAFAGGTSTSRSPNAGHPNGNGYSVDEAYDVFVISDNSAPTTPGAPTIPGSVNSLATISWPPSTDPDGDSIAYELEYSANNGSTWASISTSATNGGSYNFTSYAPTTVGKLRVRARDSNGSLSAYATMAGTFEIKHGNYMPRMMP